jgi:hypothetical protein
MDYKEVIKRMEDRHIGVSYDILIAIVKDDFRRSKNNLVIGEKTLSFTANVKDFFDENDE